jgi:predicted Zn-dependent peptidase
LVDKHFTKVADKGDQTPKPTEYAGGDKRETKELEQVHVVLGLPTVNLFDPTYYDNVILASILGGGMASRLFHEIREKRGLVYTISADQYSYSDAGMLTIYAGTGPKEVAELLPVVCEELKKATYTITEEEVNRSKNQMQAGLLMGLEGTSNRCERLAKHMHMFNRPIPMEETLEKINKVTVESVQEACKRIIKQKPTLTTLGLVEHVLSYDDLAAKLSA